MRQRYQCHWQLALHNKSTRNLQAYLSFVFKSVRSYKLISLSFWATLSLCILVYFEFSDSWDRDTSVSISNRSVLWKVIDLSPLSCCDHIMGGCPDINSCNADNNRTYQRKLLLEWRYNVSSITISTDLCRGKCIKQINSSGEFPGVASGTPKERKKTVLYDTYTHIRLVQGSRKERYLTVRAGNWS